MTLAAPGGGNGFDSSAGPAIYSSGVDENLQEMDALGATGTSLSAPIVSGVVALMLQVRPYASIAELKQALTSSAQPFEAGSGCETNCGAGIVDANAAVQMIQALSPLGRTALLQGQSASSNNNQSQSNQETGSVSSNPAGGGAISIGFGIALFLATVSAAMLRLKKVQVLLPNQFSICKPSTRSQ